MICGNEEAGPYFLYRSSRYLTDFFADADTDYAHDGGTRKWWVANVLDEILRDAWPNAMTPPMSFARVIATLMDQADQYGEGETSDRAGALTALNTSLARDGFEAFYGADRICYLRHTGTGTITNLDANPHRPLTADERERRELLEAYVIRASEDELIEDVLLPLFRHLGFERISAAGHRDKALEYGKDVWMRFMLPTRNWLYFGVQAKKGKLDASGASKGGNANVAEILNQITMMLGYKLFDPDTNKRVLVDHAYIIAGGEITKQAR